MIEVRSAEWLRPRTCLLGRLPEHDKAADLLSQAADALLAHDLPLASDLARRADLNELFEHSDCVMRGLDPDVQRRRAVATRTKGREKAQERMPSKSQSLALFARDGWRCRYCDCRIIPERARTALSKALPGAIPWGEEGVWHGAFYAMTASVDHVIPHSVGGTNDEENLVTACWACQFGRGNWSLEEVGLLDPRDRPPVHDAWDGLSRLLKRSTTAAKSPVPLHNRVLPGGQKSKHVVWTPSRAASLEAAWFDRVSVATARASRRLIDLVNASTDLGMEYRISDGLLVRMTAGASTIALIGVRPDGLVEIPWDLAGRKLAFRSFAHRLAEALPDGEVYETLKLWVVSKPDKDRFRIEELMDSAPVLRSAFEKLHADLSMFHQYQLPRKNAQHTPDQAAGGQ